MPLDAPAFPEWFDRLPSSHRRHSAFQAAYPDFGRTLRPATFAEGVSIPK